MRLTHFSGAVKSASTPTNGTVFSALTKPTAQKQQRQCTDRDDGEYV
jgi:hypothetical protein